MTKEITIDSHNKKVGEEIKKLQSKIKKLQLTYMSEAEKPQATLLQCNQMALKARQPRQEVKAAQDIKVEAAKD